MEILPGSAVFRVRVSLGISGAPYPVRTDSGKRIRGNRIRLYRIRAERITARSQRFLAIGARGKREKYSGKNPQGKEEKKVEGSCREVPIVVVSECPNSRRCPGSTDD